MAKVIAPFTPEQVVYLEVWQEVLPVHPYVCPYGENDELIDKNLIPTEAGWICPRCDYTQDWCDAHMCEEPKFGVPDSALMRQLSKGILDRLRIMYADYIAAKLATQASNPDIRGLILRRLIFRLRTCIDQYEFSSRSTPSSKEDPSSMEGNAE